MSSDSSTAFSNPERFYINLPENKEISYADLLDSYYKDEIISSPLIPSSETSNFFPTKILNLINRGETYGIRSKNYKYIRNLSENETESQISSFLSSFIELNSDDSFGNSDEFQLALDEGFFVVKPEDFLSKSVLKHTRDSNLQSLPSTISEKIGKIREIYSEKNIKNFPKSVNIILKEILEFTDKNSAVDKEKIFTELALATGFGRKKISEYFQQMIDFDKRKEKRKAFKAKFKSMRQSLKYFCASGRDWNQTLERSYQNLIGKLKDYVEFSNYFLARYEVKEHLLDLDHEIEVINQELQKLGAKRRGVQDQPIEISDEDSDSLKKPNQKLEKNIFCTNNNKG